MNPFYRLIERIYLSIPGNLAYYDTVTGVHNRLYYDRVVKRKYIDTECTVIYVDVNDLKVVNDTKGHSAGTKLLENVGDLLKCCKCNEACRIGGDEFILVYTPDKLIQEDFDWLEENANIISYGPYQKEMYEDMSSAVKKADEQMYKMKNKFHENENNA